MFIIYHPRALVRKIARDLQVTAIYPGHMSRSYTRSGKLSVLVNWGCGTILPIFDQYKHTRVLNRDISGSVRKIRTFELLRAASLPIPRISTNAHDLYAHGRYLGRTDGLTGGRGITVYEKGMLPTTEHDFYAQVVSKAVEVRIHVADGTVICEQVKYVPAGSRVLIRNRSNGATFSTKNIAPIVGNDVADSARQIAIKATAACGLDFGALDMALTKQGEWVIFEINSAPGLMLREDSTEHSVEHDVPSTYEAYSAYFASFKETQ